jgi:hypothetical protein
MFQEVYPSDATKTQNQWKMNNESEDRIHHLVETPFQEEVLVLVRKLCQSSHIPSKFSPRDEDPKANLDLDLEGVFVVKQP